MNEPFIFISSYDVKPGLLQAATERLKEVVALAQDKEEQLNSFHAFLDRDREKVMLVQVHPNAESMVTHMAVIAKHLATAWDFLDLNSGVMHLLGTPPKTLSDYAQEFKIETDRYPTLVAGFTHIPSA